MRKFKKITAILLALVLVLGVGVNVSADNGALIVPDKEGTITIHKFDSTGNSDSDEFGIPWNGTEIEDTSGFGNPLGGITFKVTLIPGATANMTAVQALAIIDAMTESELAENQHTGMTGNGGIYTFENLKQGIYLVEEVEYKNGNSTIAPFLVSIPMTDPGDHSSWLYDIHVYPKNTMADGSIDKKVLNKEGDKQYSVNANIGDEVKWVITGTFPGSLSTINPNDETKGYFYITDSLDSRLNYQGIKVEVVSPDGSTREELEVGKHYKLPAPGVGDAGTQNKDIIVDFKTAAGLEKLINSPIDSTIEITITTVINETAVTNLASPIINSGELYFNNKDGDPDDPDKPLIPVDPDPEVDLLGIAIKKVDEKGNLLDGATFTIYETRDDAEKGLAIQLNGSDWKKTSGSSLAVVGSVPVTYYKGYIYFSGEEMDELELVSTAGTIYYFVETTAPSGYDLLDNVYGLACGTTTTITNVKSPGFLLPITGGSGSLLLSIIGIALIGGGLTLIFTPRKKRRFTSN